MTKTEAINLIGMTSAKIALLPEIGDDSFVQSVSVRFAKLTSKLLNNHSRSNVCLSAEREMRELQVQVRNHCTAIRAHGVGLAHL